MYQFGCQQHYLEKCKNVFSYCYLAPPFDIHTNISMRLIFRYNGFCKGVLWPILHNVASVYTSPPTAGSTEKPDADKDIEPYDSRYAEYSMDDVAQGPIHGDGGREGELWAAFTAVNRHFTDVIIQCFNEGDLIWIHGFHLMILPFGGC